VTDFDFFWRSWHKVHLPDVALGQYTWIISKLTFVLSFQSLDTISLLKKTRRQCLLSIPRSWTTLPPLFLRRWWSTSACWWSKSGRSLCLSESFGEFIVLGRFCHLPSKDTAFPPIYSVLLTPFVYSKRAPELPPGPWKWIPVLLTSPLEDTVCLIPMDVPFYEFSNI